MRGNRDRTAIQHKNKKFQQIFIQGIGPNQNPFSPTLSYCNINDVPSAKDNEKPDLQALVDFSQSLKREQQKIEERIKQEVFQSINPQGTANTTTKNLGTNTRQQYFIKQGYPTQLEINSSSCGPGSQTQLITQQVVQIAQNMEIKQQHLRQRQISGQSALTLNGKPILLEQQQQSQMSTSLKKLKHGRLLYSPQPPLIIEQKLVPPRTSSGFRSLTPAKHPSSLQQPGSIDLQQRKNTAQTVEQAIEENNNSFNELSPELLQTVQMRHGCEVEIKEEVIHENNLSMNIEGRDSNSLQDYDREDGNNHITIIGLNSHSKQNSISNKNINQNNNPGSSTNSGSQQTTIPLLYKQHQNQTMLSKQHCISTSLIMSLQHTAVVGVKLLPSQQSTSASNSEEPLPSLSANNNINNNEGPSLLTSPKPKKMMQKQTSTIYNQTNQKFVSMLPPLKKSAGAPPSTVENNGISNRCGFQGALQVGGFNQDKAKQYNKQQQQKIHQSSTISIINMIQTTQSQPVIKNSQISKTNNLIEQIGNKQEAEEKSLQRNSSQIKISINQKKASKLFSRTGFNQNLWHNNNISNLTTITSSTLTTNQPQKAAAPPLSSSAQPQLQQAPPITPPTQQQSSLIPKSSPFQPLSKPNNHRSDQSTPILLHPSSSAIQSTRKKIEEPKLMQISQPVLLNKNNNNSSNLISQRKEEVQPSQKSPTKRNNIRQQNQSSNPLKKEASFLLQAHSTTALNKTTILKPPLPQNNTQILMPSPTNQATLTKNRFSSINEANRPQSKQGLISGTRQSPTQNLTLNNSPKKNTSSLNQTITRFTSRNRSIGVPPQANPDSDFRSRAANLVDKQNRFIEQQTTNMMPDDQQSSSSEESENECDQEEMTRRLRDILRNDDAMDFGHYIAQQIQKKRERLIKNSFSASINSKRQGPNNTTYYEHIGYCPADTTDKFRIHGAHQLDSARASSAIDCQEVLPVSHTNPGFYKSILRDQLRIFEDADIEQIIEQAQMRNYPNAVQAKQWVIAEPKKGTMIYGRESNMPNEIASQTKIMTSYVVMKLVEELDIVDLKNYYIRVTKKAERVVGTKAGLVEGQLISIYDCLHGLMLPSGNDAAIALATAFGKYLHFMNLTEKRKNLPRDAEEDLKKALLKHSNLPLKKLHEASSKMDNRLYIQAFIQEMKRYCKLMKIDDTTNFTNPHGLSDKNNHSTPADVCKIASLAMKNKLLKEIVSRRYHECTVLSREFNINLLQWFNSNKLLNDYFIGLKTGTTPSAGPCLCGYFQHGDFSIIVCLMNTKTVDTRWKDMAMLCLWALDKHMLQQQGHHQHRESIREEQGKIVKK